MNRGSILYNKMITRQKYERWVPLKIKLMIGSGLLMGLLIALGLFIGFIRGAEEIVRRIDQ